ncbi:hypothetical protein K491DRAFT_677529 [Lophiostoma macrostomum CBS 122681]|uniref:Uncharacterized protein n=1 Tax=Lophiostoma macrostomum CBS 122681 TaxID=1314788 RepID=A0A6A6TAN7_9PLEO|nr:hypothetical protein K491DRAFT_677529 [Lophiostoma macrostomum CBS 122681]
MDLLDMPPEIVQKIIANHVSEVGVCEAWRGRQTCRTFASYIAEEIFARQPTKAFKENAHSETFLRDQLAKFLIYRCRSLHGANPVLPQFIRDITARFMKTIGDDSDTMRDYLTSALSYAVGRNRDSVDRLIFNPKPATIAKLIGTKKEEHDVAAAIAIGNKTVFAAIIVGHEEYLFEDSHIFGSPLAIAAVKGEVNMVAAILDVGVRFPHENRWVRHHFLARGIEGALKRRFCTTALTILRRYREYLGNACSLPQSCLDNWILFAANGKSEETITAILQLNGDERRVADITVRGVIKHLPDSLLIREILNIGRARMKHYMMRKQSTQLLHWAVPMQSMVGVRALLDNGADPNGTHGAMVRDDFRPPVPMHSAVSNCDKDMVKLLLDRGANPNHMFDSQGQLSHVSVKKKNKSIVRLLEKAKREFKISPLEP